MSSELNRVGNDTPGISSGNVQVTTQVEGPGDLYPYLKYIQACGAFRAELTIAKGYITLARNNPEHSDKLLRQLLINIETALIKHPFETDAAKKPVKHEDCTCTDGKHYNNADETSGQYVECTDCDFNRRRA